MISNFDVDYPFFITFVYIIIYTQLLQCFLFECHNTIFGYSTYTYISVDLDIIKSDTTTILPPNSIETNHRTYIHIPKWCRTTV